YIQAEFAAVQLCFPLLVLVGLVARHYHRVSPISAEQSLVEYVIADEIIEYTGVDNKIFGGITQADVFLYIEFCLEGRIAKLVDIGAGMNAIGRDLRNIGCTKSAGNIGFKRKFVGEIIRGANTPGSTCKVLAGMGKQFIRSYCIH